jgi:hypothetical protein
MKLTDTRPMPFTYALQCDKCAVVTQYDELGYEEFVHIEHHCGYATLDDDGSHIEVDLCFQCFKTLIGPYWRIRSNWISDLQVKKRGNTDMRISSRIESTNSDRGRKV